LGGLGETIGSDIYGNRSPNRSACRP
jgi:hypothetical protein